MFALFWLVVPVLRVDEGRRALSIAPRPAGAGSATPPKREPRSLASNDTGGSTWLKGLFWDMGQDSTIGESVQ